LTQQEDSKPEITDIYAISPHFTQLHLKDTTNLDAIIQVFADRVWGWQLDIADRISRTEPHGGFAVLSIVLSYFEMIGKYRAGFTEVGRSRHFFGEGVRDVFSFMIQAGHLTDADIDLLQAQGRSGMYHMGLTGTRIVLAPEPARVSGLDFGLSEPIELPIWRLGGFLHIHPSTLVRWVGRHFSSYIAQLNDLSNTSIRANFQDRFVYDSHQPPETETDE
jgi:hypothetical protein